MIKSVKEAKKILLSYFESVDTLLFKTNKKDLVKIIVNIAIKNTDKDKNALLDWIETDDYEQYSNMATEKLGCPKNRLDAITQAQELKNAHLLYQAFKELMAEMMGIKNK